MSANEDAHNNARTDTAKRRKEILQNANFKEQMSVMFEEELRKVVAAHCPDGDYENWNKEEIIENCRTMFAPPVGAHEKIIGIVRSEKNDEEKKEDIIQFLFQAAKEHYEEEEKKQGEEQMRAIEKFVLLRTIDMQWMDHLEQMESLRDSVRLRAYAQHDPLVEYKREGHRMFAELFNHIDSIAVRTVLKARSAPVSSNKQKSLVENRGEGIQMKSNRPSLQAGNKVGRNDPCPCGAVNSAMGEIYKYKKCGLINAPYHKT